MIIQMYKESVAPRLIDPIVTTLDRDGVVIYPTDTLYGIGCAIDSPRAIERIIQIKQIKAKEALFAFICESISQIAEFARISDTGYALMRRCLPGPFTLILPGLSKVPAYFISKRKTVGVRIPDHAIPLALVKGLGRPILTTSLPVSAEEAEYGEFPTLMQERWGRSVDVIIDAGAIHPQPSTVVDLTGEAPVILRQGKGVLPQL